MSDRQPSDSAFDPTDPLVTAWADQVDAGTAPPLLWDPSTLADSVAKAHSKEQRRLIWLNIRELGAGILLAVVYGSLARGAEQPVAVWVAAVMVLAVVGFLAASSISHHWADRDWDTSIRNQMARRLAQLKHRAGLYRNLAWWYFVPLVSSTALFLYGVTGQFGIVEVVETGFFMVLCAGMYWFARRSGRNRYDSEIERLESLLAEFDRANDTPRKES